MAQGKIRLLLLWHMHQPFYKDLVSGEYRLPWVRLHALKDYYGMVKLLDEFPQVHQNFNIVPSLVAQIEDYNSGIFKDPFWDVAAKPASELSLEERHFALTYFFQAHGERMIGRYPRYRRLWEQVRSAGPDPANAAITCSERDYRDLQVLSQVAWFDEYYLEDPTVKALIEKEQGYTEEDQRFIMSKQHEILKGVLPAYRDAASRGSIELSATPYYHPILPLVCDTDTGRESVAGLPLPTERFRRPEDAEEQIRRALDAHERTFGVRPAGMWPSEGSVSDEVLGIAAQAGIKWMATDEGVLGRSIGHEMSRDGDGFLDQSSAEKLYNIYRWERDGQSMNMVYRDHRISDLLGFVYAGMNASEAAGHLLNNIKRAAAPVTDSGRDAVLSIILDGENAWESYEGNGREFLRRFYDGLQRESQIEPITISEAIERQHPDSFGKLRGLVPGSWINANFNVWIGAPEDNKAWDYLNQARDFYDANASRAKGDDRKLAYEELLIAEGSDWNWWYGPEHHSANDHDFDELYRKHLSNVYTALGGVPPDHLARPISGALTRSTFVPQTAYVRPIIDGQVSSYFDWMGAAMFSSDRRSGSMHGKLFVLEAVHAGIDEEHLYARLDFAAKLPAGNTTAAFHLALRGGEQTIATHRLDVELANDQVTGWKLRNGKATVASQSRPLGIEIALGKVLEMKVPMALVGAEQGHTFNLRFVLYRDRLPIDALPQEGSLEIQVAPEDVLVEIAYQAQ
ncbi:MAG TPA: glycoside hydrolase family 57 protein [Candidatus Saccharimonadales bacterium]|nr:glycoside hydrolase family 57 protein [Candidatus Saccharimonadales bacterium]